MTAVGLRNGNEGEGSPSWLCKLPEDHIDPEKVAVTMYPLLKPTWTRVFLPLLTLGFPLGVLLMILLRLPAEDIQVASTDTRLLRGFSTFWCGWQEVTSTHHFYAYKVPESPRVVRESFNINNLAFRFTISKGHDHYLRYHMLEGSTIEATGCAGEQPVQLDIVYGEEKFNNCWSENSYRMNVGTHNDMSHNRKNSDDEDSSSSEEDDSDESLEIGGIVRQRRSSRQKSPCDGALFSTRVQVAQEKSDQHYPTCPSRFKYVVEAKHPGVYYVVTRGDSTTLNHVLLHVRLNRTSFELPENMILCRSQNSCEIPLTFGTTEKVVVFVSAEPDAGSVLFPIRSKCKPRLIFYVCVFLVFPLMFAVGLTLAIRQARRRVEANSNQRDTTDNVADHRVGVSTRAPLLEAVVDGNSMVKSELRLDLDPPPYPVVCDPRPPSYASAVAMEQTNR